MKISVEFSATLPVKITKRKKWYLASCPILDVHSQGETEKKASDNLRNALSLFFISCFERGTLDTVLKDCGFEPAHPLPAYKKLNLIIKKDYIDVPIPFLVSQASQTAFHA